MPTIVQNGMAQYGTYAAYQVWKKKEAEKKAIAEAMQASIRVIASKPVTTEEFEMAKEFQECRLLGEGMENDSTTRSHVCPKCGGGADKEKAFIISRDATGYTFWKCFRASCGYSGSTGGGNKGKRALSRTTAAFTDEVAQLSEEQVDFFSDEYGLDNAHQNISWCPNRDSYVFKVKAPNGATIGTQLRRYDGRQPKALSFPENRAFPFIGAYPKSLDYGVVIVEDCLSALKVQSTGAYSFALLGTHLDHERAYEIRSVSPHLVLALDKGTLVLALEYRNKFADLFDKITIWTLDKDLKYVTRERIGRALADGKTDFNASI